MSVSSFKCCIFGRKSYSNHIFRQIFDSSKFRGKGNCSLHPCHGATASVCPNFLSQRRPSSTRRLHVAQEKTINDQKLMANLHLRDSTRLNCWVESTSCRCEFAISSWCWDRRLSTGRCIMPVFWRFRFSAGDAHLQV